MARNDIEIAQETGHCVKTIRRYREAMGLPSYVAVRYGNWGDMSATAKRAIFAACTVSGDLNAI